MNEIRLLAEGLVHHYGSVQALDGLGLGVHAGEIVGLLGPNGAGKTTFVRVASGQMRPGAGRVRIGTGSALADPCERAARSCLGVAPQGGAVFEGLTVRENLELFAGLHGLRGTDLRAAVAEALGFVSLEDLAGRSAGTLSGGQRQRLNLACAMVHRPGLLFLDEPTVGVDAQSRHSILEGVKRLRATGAAVLYTTHYLQEAETLCDRIGIMDHGRLLALDTLDALLTAHGGPHRILLPDREPISTHDPWRTLRELEHAGAPERFRVEGPSLEQVFLDLTGRELRD